MESDKGRVRGCALIINDELFDQNDSERKGFSKAVENLKTFFRRTQIYEIKNFWDVRMEVVLPVSSGLLKQISKTFDSYLNSDF
jgi:hypothetical protein